MVEPALSCGVEQFVGEVGVVVEFGEDSGLVERQGSGIVGTGGGVRCRGHFRGGDVGAVEVQCFGDFGGGEAEVEHLRHGVDALFSGEVGAVFVGDELVSDPADRAGGVVILGVGGDVHGDGGETRVAGGKGAALTVAHGEGAVRAADCADRLQHTVCGDRSNEVGGEGGVGADVGLQVNGVGVEVDEFADGGCGGWRGGRVAGHVGFSFRIGFRRHRADISCPVFR